MANDFVGTWDPTKQGDHAIIASLPSGINSKVLIVGPGDLGPPDLSRSYGIPLNFTSIEAAMATIPLVDPDVGNPVIQ